MYVESRKVLVDFQSARVWGLCHFVGFDSLVVLLVWVR